MTYVALIPLLPAIAFAVLVVLSRSARNRFRWIALLAVSGSLALSIAAFMEVWPGGEKGAAAHHASWPFASVGGAELSLGVLLDPVAAVMLIVVSLVGTCVQIYSFGYMHRDERVGWYFAVLSLFTAAMLALVLADNFLMLFMAWEVMGLCSYLLIGFWHEQEGPRKAALKAFLTTRVGDIGLVIGLAVIYATVGSFDYDVVLGSSSSWAPGVATAVALLLLVGAMGKSAQVPLHVWLPDAMAGPTPASALIHAATMVAAGVFLVYRALPIFEASGIALLVTMVVGVTTVLVGGLLAAVQHDIKKVLAYSTISQLGYMFVALGAGGAAAGMFHLVTHAFFKALLFLGAGVIIHAAHTQDIREMGGLARHMRWTSVTFGVGALALAGVFPFSGFWSKDEVLYALYNGGHWVVFALALAGAFVTAFYVARLWFRVFTGPEQTENLKEGHAEMIAPMTLLAALTCVIGFFAPAFSEFLGYRGHWPDPFVAFVSTVVALAGLALGWWAYGRSTVVLNTRALKRRAGYLYGPLAQKLYFDLTYEHLFVRPYANVAHGLYRFDVTIIDGAVNGAGAAWRGLAARAAHFDSAVIDGVVNGLASYACKAGGALRRIQVGRIRAYQAYIVGAVVLLMLWIVVKGA